MKKYFRFIISNVLKFIVLSFVIFLLSFFIVDLINNNNAYYEASFNVDNINQYNHQLLVDKDFLNEVKESGANGKYANINVDKMLDKNDFSYTINENKITITTKYKYYDLFFLSSNNSVGTRAKMFIKDSVIKSASLSSVNVVFEDNENIVKLNNSLNRWVISFVCFSISVFIELIVSLFLYKKERIVENESYDNVSNFKHCFNKNYWKLAFKPLNNVKDITTIGMLFALMLASKLIPIPSGFGNLGLSFTYLFFAIICMIYGPIYGFVVGIFSDVIGFFMPNSGGGIFNLGYTLQAALCGFIYGICFFKRKLSFKRVLLSRFLVNIFMNAIYGSFLFIFVTYYNIDSTMTLQSYLEKVKYYSLLLSLPKNVVYLLPQSILLYYVLKTVSPILYRFKLVNNKKANKI